MVLSKWFGFLGRLPLTLATLVVVFVVHGVVESHFGSQAVSWRQAFGLAPADLVGREWYRLVTSFLVTGADLSFYLSVLMLAGCLGSAEWLCGSKRTLLTFLGVHLVTLLGIWLLIAWPLATMGVIGGRLLFYTRDVGPSAGYYGCLGLAVAVSQPKLRSGLGMAILVLLLVRVVWSWLELPEQGQRLTADLAHLISFPLGAYSAIFWRCQVPRSLED